MVIHQITYIENERAMQDPLEDFFCLYFPINAL